jgi:hypothetical protein
LQVTALDRERETFALLDAALLKRRGRADGGVESDVVQFIARGARFDIPSVFAVGLGERSSTRVFAG